MVLQHVGSSIKAAQLSNRHIWALESDVELFDEVLEPLKQSASLSSDPNIHNDDDMEVDDDSSPVIDKPFNDLCK